MASTEDDSARPRTRGAVPWPFVAGVLLGVAGAYLARTWAGGRRRRLDPRLVRALRAGREAAPTVVIPGLLGSRLLRADGTEAWLNVANAFGHHDLRLPPEVTIEAAADGLRPGGLLGTDAVLPRLFGFSEYADLVDLLEQGGFRRAPHGPGPSYHVFSYDWRADLVRSAQALGAMLDALAESMGDPGAQFNLIGHSMGGLVARYYLRYGAGPLDDNAPVSWAGAHRVQSLALVAAPNGGSIPALGAILNGERVGFSHTTLAASVVAGMPSVYQLLPPVGTRPLIDRGGAPVDADLHDVETWRRFGWGPFATRPGTTTTAVSGPTEEQRAFVGAALARAAAFHRALTKRPTTACPARVVALGGDCLPTLARAIVAERPGTPPRLEPFTSREGEWMFEAGDGRVTRASVLASHLTGADDSDTGSGLPEVSQVFFGSADHHGIYQEPTFQSLLLRLLLRPRRRGLPAAG